MTTSKKPNRSAPRASTAPSTTGKGTAREAISLIPIASPDDPIFRTGFVIGATRLRNSSKDTPAKN